MGRPSDAGLSGNVRAEIVLATLNYVRATINSNFVKELKTFASGMAVVD